MCVYSHSSFTRRPERKRKRENVARNRAFRLLLLPLRATVVFFTLVHPVGFPFKERISQDAISSTLFSQLKITSAGRDSVKLVRDHLCTRLNLPNHSSILFYFIYYFRFFLRCFFHCEEDLIVYSFDATQWKCKY